MKPKDNPIREPIGRLMRQISKITLASIQQKTSDLDIEHYFYPLLIIDEGEGKLTQQELADKLSCDKAQVVRIIDYLSFKGYVVRTLNNRDRRKYGLSITEKAKKAIPEIKKAITETSDIALNGLSERKTDELYEMLGLIKSNLQSYKIHFLK